jgi:hypothetical protein
MLLARPMDYESSDYDGLWKHQVLYHKHNLIKSLSSMVHVGRSRTLGHRHPLTLHHAATEAGRRPNQCGSPGWRRRGTRPRDCLAARGVSRAGDDEF